MTATLQLLNFPGLAELGPEFHYRLAEIAVRLRLNPSYMAGVMFHESGFDPAIRNRWCTQQAAASGYGSSWIRDHCAAGLIQWMPATAAAFGVTTDEIVAMSAVEQLGLVERYFRPFAGRATSMADHYLIVFWPAAVGKPLSHVLAREGSAAYSQNKGLDLDHDGAITVGDIEAQMRDRVLARATGRPPILVPDAPDPTWGKQRLPIGVFVALLVGSAAGVWGTVQALRAFGR